MISLQIILSLILNFSLFCFSKKRKIKEKSNLILIKCYTLFTYFIIFVLMLNEVQIELLILFNMNQVYKLYKYFYDMINFLFL